MEHSDLPRRNSRRSILIGILAFAAGALLVKFLFFRTSSPSGISFTAHERANAGELPIKGDTPDGTVSWSGIDLPPKPPVTAALKARGKTLFDQACAACHGAEGKGDGIFTQRYDLPSLPANLTTPLQSVKIRSTFSGIAPRDEDLFRTLTRGLPGTAMWSYRALSADERWALVLHIAGLRTGSESNSEEIKIPAMVPKDGEMTGAAKNMYLNLCSNCHGTEGLGGSVPLQDSFTGKSFPGIKFAREGGMQTLSGSSEMDIARTLMTGFHERSPMRSFKPYFYPRENPLPAQRIEGDRKLWGLVHYVRDLMDAQK